MMPHIMTCKICEANYFKGDPHIRSMKAIERHIERLNRDLEAAHQIIMVLKDTPDGKIVLEAALKAAKEQG